MGKTVAKIRVFFLHGFLGQPEDGLSLRQHLPKDWEWNAIDYQKVERLNSKNELLDWGSNFCEAITALPQEGFQNILVGYSLGGRLAQQAFNHNSNLFSKMICISSHVGLSSQLERKERYKNDQRWAFRFMREPFQKVITEWNAQPVFIGGSSEPKRREKDFDKSLLADSLLRWSLAKQVFRPEVFLKNQNRIFWVVGSLDEKYKAFASQLVQQSFICESFEVEKSGHRVLFDRPKDLAKVLLRIVTDF